jgi:hypothetical protein
MIDRKRGISGGNIDEPETSNMNPPGESLALKRADERSDHVMPLWNKN